MYTVKMFIYSVKNSSEITLPIRKFNMKYISLLFQRISDYVDHCGSGLLLFIRKKH